MILAHAARGGLTAWRRIQTMEKVSFNPPLEDHNFSRSGMSGGRGALTRGTSPSFPAPDSGSATE
jgi:hypothetical protein